MLCQGDVAAARPLAEQALAIVREVGDRASLAWALNQAGRLATLQGDTATGLPLLEEALRVSRAEGLRVLEVFVVLGFGYAAYFQGDRRPAWARFQEGLALARSAENPTAIAMALAALGLAATEQGHFREAHALLVASLEERQRVGDVGNVSFMLSCFAGLAAAKRQYERALRLEGAAEALRQASGSQAPDPYLGLVERRLDSIRHAIGEHVAARAAAEGRGLAAQQAIELALAVHDPADRRRHRSAAGCASAHAALSPREQEVAALLALGLTNRQIAERLVITPRTAAAHVEHLLNKLGFASRHQVGAWVAEHSTGT
jgi:non-specific serine/threonine protein kinase